MCGVGEPLYICMRIQTTTHSARLTPAGGFAFATSRAVAQSLAQTASLALGLQQREDVT